LGWDRTTLIDGGAMAPPIFEKNYILVLKIWKCLIIPFNFTFFAPPKINYFLTPNTKFLAPPLALGALN
jgi:hypothetical protein